VQGGFDSTFDLDDRDPLGGRTRWSVASGASGPGVQGGDPAAVLDGIALDGSAGASIGLDVVDASLELRAVSVVGFADRGMRVRNSSAEDLDLVIASSSTSSNGADGLTLAGAYDVHIDGSSFASNGQEGIELGPLVALDGDTARLEISGSTFVGNATEGLDASLDAPALGGSAGGRFTVEIRGSSFEANGAAGCLVDAEYEAFPSWSADVLVRESRARANRGPGFHVDADARITVFLHRLLSSANADHGFVVSSESDPGLALASACVAAGNQGSGFRATAGERALAASHCIAAGNAAGGFTNDVVEGSVTSSLAWLQPAAWTNARDTASTSVLDPTLPGAPLFEHAPEEYRLVLATSGTTLTLDRAPDFAGSVALELADDGAALLATQISGASVVLASAPTAFVAPGTLAAFPPGTGVAEDYRLPVGSAGLGTGMTPPGAAAVDAGVHGAPLGGDPGTADPVARPLFRPVATDPATSAPLGANTPIVVTFSADLASASVVPGAVRVVTASENELAISTQVAGATLLVDPPPAGWGSEPFELELHRFLASTAGEPLAAPVALPFTP
jgi:hypothetical protein